MTRAAAGEEESPAALAWGREVGRVALIPVQRAG
jgi:hypothetical protein